MPSYLLYPGMSLRPPNCCLLATAGLALLLPAAPPARASATRECLDQARSAALEIQLTGDQSAALRDISLELVKLDPRAIQPIVAGMRRPSDAARCLAALALARAATDPLEAADYVTTAGRILLRISNPDHRLAEQRLLLEETSALGAAAISAGPELEPAEAQLIVLLARARRDPAAALALFKQWQPTGAEADRVLAVISVGLADTDPDQALELAATILSAATRDQAMLLIASKRPPDEITGVALRFSDPLLRSAALSRAAVSTAREEPASAVTTAGTVEVAPNSTLAEVAVATAALDQARALELARSLPGQPRAWALSRIAVDIAAAKPALAEDLLREAGSDPQAICLAVAHMAAPDPDRALSLARSQADARDRDAALALLVRAWAAASPGRAADVVWEIGSPEWQAVAVEPLALTLAQTDTDAATSLIGLVADPARAGRISSKVAAAAAARDPDLAARLLATLPPSDYRGDACLGAAVAALGAGASPKAALRLGAIGLDPDLALRWALPSLAYSQTRSPINLAGEIRDPYRRALALVGVAFELGGGPSRSRPAPERAALIRPIVEWEGI